MKQPNCCLTIVLPGNLGGNIIGHLLEHYELAAGFTSYEVKGHGKGAIYHSASEQVRGWARRIKMEVVMERGDAESLVAHLKESLPTSEVAYWIAPLYEFGRFA